MQTKEQVHAKIAMMLRNLPHKLFDEVDRLLASGAVNFDDADDDYRLPTLVYVTALRNIAEGYTPLCGDTKGKKALKHLARF